MEQAVLTIIYISFEYFMTRGFECFYLGYDINFYVAGSYVHGYILTMPIKKVLNVNQCSLILRCVIQVGIHSHHKSRSAPPDMKEKKQSFHHSQCSAVERDKLLPFSLSQWQNVPTLGPIVYDNPLLNRIQTLVGRGAAAQALHCKDL